MVEILFRERWLIHNAESEILHGVRAVNFWESVYCTVKSANSTAKNVLIRGNHTVPKNR